MRFRVNTRPRTISRRAFLVAPLGVVVPMLCAAQSAPRLLRDRRADERPTLLVLGTAHFANPGLDVVNIEVDDVRTTQRQAELDEVVERLAAFEPTHIAVEVSREKQGELDSRYREYLAGRYELDRSEVSQLGLRLAARVGHQRVHAVDWNDYPPGDFDRYYDWGAYLESRGDESALAALTKRNGSVGAMGNESVGEWLRRINASERLAEAHRPYFDIAMVGDEEFHPGANWVGHWYARNFRIFRNLVQLTSGPRDRVLVVYGLGHAYLLRRFATESGAFRVVDVDEVL